MKRTALITGASSGIGYALAEVFAAKGHDLIMVAKDVDKLEKTASQIKGKYAIEIVTIAKDLTIQANVQSVYDEVISEGITVEIVVNDAGIGKRGAFQDVPLEDQIETVELNIIALIMLTHLFLRDMKERNSGKILNLGSIAGFEPGPLLSVYHGTKAFVVMFSESLMEELKDTEVSITCLCPGPVDTSFFPRANMEDANVITRAKALVMQPEEVAESAYEGLMNGERIVMPGSMNKVMTFTRRLIPLGLQAKINKKFYERNEE
jgi:short-subunit dehydrogenase